jgi:hypothetical protein
VGYVVKYPTRAGLIVPPEELGYPTVPHSRRNTTNHHGYFNRVNYTDVSFRRIFRGLITNVYTLDLRDHQDLHERYSAPVMPKDSLMIDVVDEYLAINGVIDVVREKRTCDTYQVFSDQWLAIRNQRGGLNEQQETYQSPVGLIGI